MASADPLTNIASLPASSDSVNDKNNTTARILVVDDDNDSRANLRDLLELDCFDVRLAANAIEAQRQIEESSFDIIIFDWKLPDGRAEDLLAEFRVLTPSSDIIIVSGYVDMDSSIAAMRNGASDFILKPINPDGLRSRVQKILERRQMEHDLHQEHQFGNKLLSTAEAVVLVLDLYGQISTFNPYLTRITGWESEEVKGRDWFETFIPAEYRDTARTLFSKGTADSIASGVVNPILTRSGQVRQIRWSITKLSDEAGDVTSVLAIGLDVTDLIEAQSRALRSERLATIGQTMTALAHESRNALQRIQASSDLLELEVAENPQARSDLASIRRAAKGLNTLLEEVRSFAAPIQLNLESVRLKTVVRQSWSHLRHAIIHRNAQIEIESTDADVEIQLDTLRIEQVFRNLFENSLAACEDPVMIQVSCRNLDGQFIEVVVQDNGPGILPEQSAHIFEAFFTTKDTGTGLGMAIAQRIVEAHGGTISVDHRWRDGARFVIRLPVRRCGHMHDLSRLEQRHSHLDRDHQKTF